MNTCVCSCSSQSFSSPSFSSPANSTPATSSVIFQSCKFHPLFLDGPSFSTPANSSHPFDGLRPLLVTSHCLLSSLASCLIYGQPFRHTSWPRPTSISLTACTHFRARLGAFFYWTGCFENNVPFDNTAQIYLVNLHWKLGLRFKLRLRVALF